jgi:hypothetical protein
VQRIHTGSDVGGESQRSFPTQADIFIVHQRIETASRAVFDRHTNTRLQTSTKEMNNVRIVHNALKNKKTDEHN